MISEIR